MRQTSPREGPRSVRESGSRDRQLCPFWDGEDDRFNVRKAKDAALLPKLKSVVLFFDEDDAALKALRKRGIEAKFP